MSDQIQRSVPMPPSRTHPSGCLLPIKDRVLVVIGANGSGKTRFGSWLDSRDIKHSYRVSAHRALGFPERVTPMDLDEAQLRLFTGHHDKDLLTSDALFKHFRANNRWGKSPETALLNDFEPLVTLMVSERLTVAEQYLKRMQNQKEYTSPPTTRLDTVKEIWEMILPARELLITGTKIEARNRTETVPYHAREMSDGERSIFHLIGEALSVPQEGVFVVDEPELHLHRAIQARLWDAIETARPDCTFVYITHDLEFAASRKDATKIWLREYQSDIWDWEVVPETEFLPEPLLLEVIGSRRPILFVEGDHSSLDYFIYGQLFPKHTVIPCGSCETVVHSSQSFRKMKELHHNTCSGLVDNDGRTETDIKFLNGLGIAVLPVALIENLFLIESVLVLASEKLGHIPGDSLPKVKERVFATLKRNSVSVISNLTRQEIESSLRNFGKSGNGADELLRAFKNASESIDPLALYAKWEREITRTVEEKDYSAALRYYKIKGLSSEAGSILGVKYHDLIIRWLRSSDRAAFLKAFQTLIGEPS